MAVFEKRSRYRNARLFTPRESGERVFGGIRPRPTTTAPGVIEYIIKDGDRLDLIALHFYNDSRRWWRILDANPQIIFGADLMLKSFVGETILIPRAAEPGGEQ